MTEHTRPARRTRNTIAPVAALTGAAIAVVALSTPSGPITVWPPAPITLPDPRHAGATLTHGPENETAPEPTEADPDAA